MTPINKNISKRKVPNQETLEWRERYLRSVESISFSGSYLTAPLLEPGNSKTGTHSKDYDKVMVWNLPVVITCPSASAWCLRHCYNADPREETFPIAEWHKNLEYYHHDKLSLERKLIATLSEPDVRMAVRIHSSGDFFEREYVEFWKRIIEATPSVKYWAYTRSWQNQQLLQSLEELSGLGNIQLFASWDKTMAQPPQGWRKSFVYTPTEVIVQSSGIVCPEQSGTSPNCATCNYCITSGIGDVYFILH